MLLSSPPNPELAAQRSGNLEQLKWDPTEHATALSSSFLVFKPKRGQRIIDQSSTHQPMSGKSPGEWACKAFRTSPALAWAQKKRLLGCGGRPAARMERSGEGRRRSLPTSEAGLARPPHRRPHCGTGHTHQPGGGGLDHQDNTHIKGRPATPAGGPAPGSQFLRAQVRHSLPRNAKWALQPLGAP